MWNDNEPMDAQKFNEEFALKEWEDNMANDDSEASDLEREMYDEHKALVHEETAMYEVEKEKAADLYMLWKNCRQLLDDYDAVRFVEAKFLRDMSEMLYKAREKVEGELERRDSQQALEDF